MAPRGIDISVGLFLSLFQVRILHVLFFFFFSSQYLLSSYYLPPTGEPDLVCPLRELTHRADNNSGDLPDGGQDAELENRVESLYPSGTCLEEVASL